MFQPQYQRAERSQGKARLEDVRLDQEFAELSKRKAKAAQVKKVAAIVDAPARADGASFPPSRQGVSLTETDIARLALLYRHEVLRQDEQDCRNIPAPDSPQAIQAKKAWQEHQDLVGELSASKGLEYTPEPFRASRVQDQNLRHKRSHAETFIRLAGQALANGYTSLIADKETPSSSHKALTMPQILKRQKEKYGVTYQKKTIVLDIRSLLSNF